MDICTGIYRELSLETESRALSDTSGERTHVKDTTNFIELQHPGSDRIAVVLRTEGSGEHIPFASFDYVTPDPIHDSAIERLVSGPSGVYVDSLTHIVNCSIASRTD